MSEKSRKYAQQLERDNSNKIVMLKSLLKRDEPFEEVVSLGEKPGTPLTEEEIDSLTIHEKKKKKHNDEED